MEKRFGIAGVPGSLVHDAWWLGPDNRADGGKPGTTGGVQARLPIAPGLFGLVLLADVLFWRQAAGLSLAVFAVAILAVALATAAERARPAGPVALLCLGVLPVVEYLQPLSAGFLIVSLIIALVWLRAPGLDLADRLAAGGRVLLTLPFRAIRLLAGLLSRGIPAGKTGMAGNPVLGELRKWAFPVGGTLVFAALLRDANPVIASLFDLRFDPGDIAGRAMFWSGTGLLIWPLLDLDLRQRPASAAPGRSFLPQFGINAASALRALVPFNLLIGLQTVLDLSIFVGGAALPEGMTYAAYAHRGAYPLLATALLAGAFAMAARPYLAGHRLIRPLMLLWLAQNVALGLSALLRLELYVGVYGLTYLRVWAMIWIGLVVAGLVLLIWQTVRGESNAWALRRILGMGVVTLYTCTFINFAGVIAAHNLRQQDMDERYFCVLGPNAAAAVAAARADSDHRSGGFQEPYCIFDAPQISGWRDWGFRKWRIARYLNQTQPPDAAHGHSDR